MTEDIARIRWHAGDRGEVVITSVNDHYVFVRYGSQQATSPEDLTLLSAATAGEE